MKRTLLTSLVVALLLFSCKTSTQKIIFADNVLSNESTLSNINIRYPVAQGENSAAISKINDAIINSLLSEENPTLESYISEAKTLESDSIPYQVATEWSGFGNGAITSINIEQYIYAGGAHGGTNVITLTFDNVTGDRINLRDQISDTVAFQEIMAKEYATQNDLDINTPPGDIGYFTELSKLPIPSTMLLTDKGLKVIFSQYEIACYAVGITSVTIPYDKLTSVFSIIPETLKPIEPTAPKN